MIGLMLPPLAQSQAATFAKPRCARLKITIEYHELAVREASEIREKKESGSNFMRENNRLSFGGGFDFGIPVFAIEAHFQYSSVSERETAKSQSKENKYAKKITFMNHQLQLSKKVTTLFTINGYSARIVTNLHVATVSANKTKDYKELRRMANLETVRIYGNNDGKIQFNSYVRTECFKRMYLTD